MFPRIALAAALLTATASPVDGSKLADPITPADVRASMARVEHVLANQDRTVLGFATQTAPRIELVERGTVPLVSAFAVRFPRSIAPECREVLLDRAVARAAISQFDLTAEAPAGHKDEAADELARAVAMAIWADTPAIACLYRMRGAL